MDIYEIIRKRRSIRRFKQEKIPLEILEKFIDAARLAPSGGNVQPWEFIIVNDEELLDKVFETLSWAAYIAPYGTPPEGKRPTAYIVVLQNKKTSPLTPAHDIAAAIENILLCATKEGIGSCWIASIKREKLSQILGIPPDYHIDSVVALGYPDEISVIEEFKGSVKYWKDENGVMHVPKRNLKDIIHYNKF
ncbi:MAG TPA: nitroreductase [Firmicutes bacterium]|nr:MAG: nitroreductase [Candidatus Omnitrophota bacterium]HDD64550.1 nitroreductase [Bacillota bacterium]